MRLIDIRDNKGARTRRRIVGRGIGSGLGKTCGRGGKGQTARSGVAINGFEGGQNPIYRRLPKRGFNNIHASKYFELTFDKVNVLLANGLVKAGDTVDRNFLIQAGVMKKWYDAVSLVSTGILKEKVSFEVTRTTKNASAQVEKLGGKIVIA
ncbi:50S ribosomal protein L15 [Candidatus Paracaedibacter acanthamoebae]|uniref:Large ribosomal subunit protein uL15 n=1 Tax=Candidatus Odyssella acanthamoebae TaxID=91604 RepID=A0A077AYP9_9PROT|nr:50S ribosomal protein L15 [Candidatus Paracaedibacter acanthamoebae]